MLLKIDPNGGSGGGGAEVLLPVEVPATFPLNVLSSFCKTSGERALSIAASVSGFMTSGPSCT